MAVELPFDDILNAAYIYLSSLDEHNLLKRKYIMNDLKKLCRFCLKQTNYCSFGDVEIIRDMLSALNLKMNLDISEEPVICANCTENLHRFFTFKVICVETENRLLPFINPEVDKKICLSQIYLQINNSESLDNKDVCRFCLCETPSGSSMQLNTVLSLTSPIKNDLETFFPEMNFNLVKDPMMCKICFNSLLEYLMFTKKCLATEENIQRYLVVDAVDVNVKLDLKRVQQFLDREIIKEQIDDIDTFEPVTHELQKDGDVKEELLSEEDIKSENCIQIEDPQLDIKEDNLELKFVVDSYASIPEAIKDIGKQEVGELIQKKETAPICITPTIFQSSKWFFETESRENYYKHSELHKEHSYINQSNRYCEYIAKQICCSQPDLVHHNSFPFIKVHERKHGGLNKQKVTNKNSSKVLMDKHENEDLLIKSKHTVSLSRNVPEVTNYRCVYKGRLFKTRHRGYLARHKLFHRNLSERLRNYKEIHSNSSIVTVYKCENEEWPFGRKHKVSLGKRRLIDKDSSKLTMYKCENEGCSYETKHKYNLARHKLIHKNSSEVTMYKCKSKGCSYEARYKSYLTNHQLIHKDVSEVTMYKCNSEGCLYETNRKNNLITHQITHKHFSEVTMYKCRSEGWSHETSRKYTLPVHELIHKDSSEVTMYKCGNKDCLYETTYKGLLISHALIHKSPSEVTLYKCGHENCSFETKRKRGLRKHSLIHKDPSEVTMYKCEKGGCSYETKYKYYLTKHLLIHKDRSEVTMYKCEFEGCSYETKRKYNLTEHLLTHKVSSEVTMYTCETEGCSYETKHKRYWARHVLTHTDCSGAAIYKCESEGCSYETKRKYNLPKHLLTHKASSEVTMYKSKSEEYSYETKRKYDLSTNLRTYKGPAELRMYKCETEGCLYQAKGKNNWIKHQLIHQDSSEATR